MSYIEEFRKNRRFINIHEAEIKALEARLKPLTIVSTILDELSEAERLKNATEVNKILLRIIKHRSMVIKVLNRLEELEEENSEKYANYTNKLNAFNIILRIKREMER